MATCKLLCLLLLTALVGAKDFYDMFGIAKSADNRDIRRAFKKLALKMHPDKNPNDEEAHDRFIKINRAYEVLKDEEMRKKYDLHGEEGLEDDFGKSWKGNYQSWNYYYESFGIYDDDPEVITLSRSDFEQSVLGSPFIWFINFYSPQCSHCHHLAPAWRTMARELEGVIRIGAVNCEEDWMICRKLNIRSYPTLMLFPDKETYRGSREADEMVAYILKNLPNKVIDLNEIDVMSVFAQDEYKHKPWLICICKVKNDCIFDDVLKNLGIILDGIVNVARADVKNKNKLCDFNSINCDAQLAYYYNISAQGHIIEETETKSILNQVLKMLPPLQELSDNKLMDINEKLMSSTAHPWLIEFTREGSVSNSNTDTEMKKLGALLPGIEFGFIDCEKYPKTCNFWAIRKFPTFMIMKPGDGHEFHYGRLTAYDIATFVQESISSQVNSLSDKDFPSIVESSNPWFIDFFAPWCPPCMQLLPEFKKASRNVGHLVKFGTVDCTIHSTLCNKYNIRSYPTTILYNQSSPYQFHGSHTHVQLEEFVHDTLNPQVVSLNEETFNKLLKQKSTDVMWAVDFYAPWCGPCQQLSPQWRKLAKMLKHDPTFHIGQVDCTKFSSLCHELQIHGYPTIRLYPKGTAGITQFHYYNGWNRDANSLQAWIHSLLPSKVKALDDNGFNKVLSDTNPWIIDFYAPWCGHCQTFAPEFEKVAETVTKKVKTGKVNCDSHVYACRKAGVRAYPTVVFYSGRKGKYAQSPVGEEIQSMNYMGVITFIETKLSTRFVVPHDEL